LFFSFLFFQNQKKKKSKTKKKKKIKKEKEKSKNKKRQKKKEMFSIRNIFISSILLLLFDYVYLRVCGTFLQRQIKNIQGTPLVIRWIPLVLCYICIILGLNYFILSPKRTIQDAFFLGIFVYGVYEFTNFATFTNWSVFMVCLDTLWGGVLFALTTFLFYYIVGLF